MDLSSILSPTLPPLILAGVIFALRTVDVSVGTVRTLAIVSGKVRTAVVLGFFEVLIWILVVSQVVRQIENNPWLAIAFAGGFASGNALGIFIEKRLAFGSNVLRILSSDSGTDIAEALRTMGQAVTTFEGRGREGPVMLIYVISPRARAPALIAAARSIDPNLVYVTERAENWSLSRTVIAQPTGWRAFWKKK